MTAFTNYIIKSTDYQKIAYIGHSMGTTQAFYGLATNNAFFAERWNLYVALAPVASTKGY